MQAGAVAELHGDLLSREIALFGSLQPLDLICAQLGESLLILGAKAEFIQPRRQPHPHGELAQRQPARFVILAVGGICKLAPETDQEEGEQRSGEETRRRRGCKTDTGDAVSVCHLSFGLDR